MGAGLRRLECQRGAAWELGSADRVVRGQLFGWLARVELGWSSLLSGCAFRCECRSVRVEVVLSFRGWLPVFLSETANLFRFSGPVSLINWVNSLLLYIYARAITATMLVGLVLTGLIG